MAARRGGGAARGRRRRRLVFFLKNYLLSVFLGMSARQKTLGKVSLPVEFLPCVLVALPCALAPVPRGGLYHLIGFVTHACLSLFISCPFMYFLCVCMDCPSDNYLSMLL